MLADVGVKRPVGTSPLFSFSAWRITWAAGVAFSLSIRLPGVSFMPCSKQGNRRRVGDIQLFHSFFSGARPSGEPLPVLSPARRASVSPAGRRGPDAPRHFSRCTQRPPSAPPGILSCPGVPLALDDRDLHFLHAAAAQSRGLALRVDPFGQNAAVEAAAFGLDGFAGLHQAAGHSRNTSSLLPFS